jgi:hypothetical protein
MTWLFNRQREDKMEENDGRTTNEVVMSIEVAERSCSLSNSAGQRSLASDLDDEL